MERVLHEVKANRHFLPKRDTARLKAKVMLDGGNSGSNTGLGHKAPSYVEANHLSSLGLDIESRYPLILDPKLFHFR